MNPRFRNHLLFLLLIPCVLFLVSTAHAAKPIAKITSFKGEVFLQTGSKIVDVKTKGMPLMQGDSIQTKQGEAEILFGDGAVMRVRPFTSTMIQEREEEKGWWIFKTKKAVRRMTVFVGKLWFKSGASKRQNFMQTPTAVCGLRGTTLWFGGTATGQASAAMISGDFTAVVGSIARVANVSESTLRNALQSVNYSAIIQTKQKLDQAIASGDPEQIKAAQIAVINEVVVKGAEAIQAVDPAGATALLQSATAVKENIETGGALSETPTEGGTKVDVTIEDPATSEGEQYQESGRQQVIEEILSTTTTTTTSSTTTTTSTTTTSSH
ncbi:hypothetical protein ACFL9T_11505 [Thermodesulfobacteriota bacterium]